MQRVRIGDGLQAAARAFRASTELLVGPRTLGAGPLACSPASRYPLAAPGLVAGAAMSWARSLGEFGATLMFAGNLSGRTQTLPLAIYSALEADLRAAQALALLLVVVAFGLLLVVRAGARDAVDPTGRGTRLDVAVEAERGAFSLDVTLAVDGVLAVVGRNAAGKTTLLGAILGVLPSRGSIVLGGRSLEGVPTEARRLGYVPQQGALFPHLDVRRNVAFGARRDVDEVLAEL